MRTGLLPTATEVFTGRLLLSTLFLPRTVGDIYFPSTSATFCSSCRRSDYIAIHEEIGQKNNFTLTEKYCNKDFLPGPYATRNVVKLIFHSNEKDSNVGFKASYKFVPVRELQQREWLLLWLADGWAGR